MDGSLFLRTILCCSVREYKYNTLDLEGVGKSFVIANETEFWIVKAYDQQEALENLVSKTWNNSHLDFRINSCGWGDYEYIVAELKEPVISYDEHGCSDTEFLKLLSTVRDSEEVFITQEYFDPDDYELWPSMPI